MADSGENFGRDEQQEGIDFAGWKPVFCGDRETNEGDDVCIAAPEPLGRVPQKTTS